MEGGRAREHRELRRMCPSEAKARPLGSQRTKESFVRSWDPSRQAFAHSIRTEICDLYIQVQVWIYLKVICVQFKYPYEQYVFVWKYTKFS